MKLLNRSLAYLSLAFFLIIGIWSVLFYFNLKDEIRDSIDDGLDNNRVLILQKIKTDSTLLYQNDFGGNNFKIGPIARQNAFTIKDRYKDTLMYRLNENDLEPVRVLHSAFEHMGKYYKLTLISSLVEEDDLIEDSFWSVFWLFIVLISSVIIINNIILRKVWNPFYTLLNRLRTYRLDKNEDPIQIETRTKEFIQLQEASNALINHAKEAYTAQKQFTENASHELQTPIAIIINKLELFLEDGHLNGKDADTIAEVIHMAERLKKLNATLLLLTKIENKQFIERSSVSINQIVKAVQAHFSDLADFKNIAFQMNETDTLWVQMNSSLAEILVSNLIKNAIFHNIKNGKIRIDIHKNSLCICNTGNGESLNAKTIFNRFDKDRSKDQGTGLGLAVSKAICKLYGLDISYMFREGQHCFSINFTKIGVAP